MSVIQLDKLKDDREELCFNLGVLHSAYAGGGMKQADYNIRLDTFRYHISKIEKAIFDFSPSEYWKLLA